ncbi:HAD family hydrolase [Emergencia timonensis]|uniref:HAD family hydrolase n=1 Tax=Emergencia timonensis TaxID=1776384 RepID=UPI00399357E7
MEDKKIKMVALDLDGTTLNSQKEISPRTIAAFQNAMRKGTHIVVSTGRTFRSLPAQLFGIEGLEYIVTSNGAHITELATRKTIYENYLTPHAVEEVVRVLRNTSFSIETFVGGKAYIDSAEYEDVVANGSTYRDADYIINTRNPIPHIWDYMIQNKHQIENISINFEFAEDKEKWQRILERIDDITLTSSFKHNFEIGGANTSKAEALRFLMRRLDVEPRELMACGDSPNDIEMIKLAEIGVVVGNASEEMKSLANYVTDTNDNDGVAKAIENFVL